MMLCRTVDKRCTAQEALIHPWLTGLSSKAVGDFSGTTKKDGESAFQITTKLKAFYEQSQLQKKAMQVIAHRLQDDEIRELGKTFLALDTNHDGVVTVQELQRGLLQMQGKFEGEPGMQDLMRIMA